MRRHLAARLAGSVVLLVAFPFSGKAQDVKTSQNISITLRGILSGTLFAQDAAVQQLALGADDPVQVRPYALGLEWLDNETKLGSGDILAGNQVLLSARYDF